MQIRGAWVGLESLKSTVALQKSYIACILIYIVKCVLYEDIPPMRMLKKILAPQGPKYKTQIIAFMTISNNPSL